MTKEPTTAIRLGKLLRSVSYAKHYPQRGTPTGDDESAQKIIDDVDAFLAKRRKERGER